MKISLSPMDYYFFRRQLYTIQFGFEYDGTLDVATFEQALERTARLLPVLTSRIEVLSDRKLAFETTDSVIPLQKITAGGASIGDDEADTLFDTIINAPEEPLVKVRITQADKKAYVGFSFSHMLGDGFSFFTFIRVLSGIMKKQELPKAPSHNRQNLFNIASSNFKIVTEKRLFQDTGYVIPRPKNPLASQVERIRFSREDLLSLKAEASKTNGRVTTNDAIMAYLLKHYRASIPLTDDGQLIVRCPVDYRKIYSLVPENYFGNAVRDAVACFDPVQFDKLDLSAIASEIRTAIDYTDETSVYQSLACLNDLRLERGIGVFESMGCPGLLVSNFSKLPFSIADFGLGAPTRILHASLNPRLAVIFPREDGVEVKFKRPS